MGSVRAMRLWLVMLLGLGACSVADADPISKDTRDAVDSASEVATEVLAETDDDVAEEVAAEVDDDVDDDVEVDDDAEVIEDGEVTLDVDVPLDRNCNFEVRTGNHWPDDVRCRPCRALVGSFTTEVTTTLLWWATYDNPPPAPPVCDAYPGQVCRATVIEAEVFVCGNNETQMSRIVWADVVQVTLGEGEAQTVEIRRGPSYDVLLGELRDADDEDLLIASDVFVPGTFSVHPEATDRGIRVTTAEGRPGQSCPVGSLVFADDRSVEASIAECPVAFSMFGTPPP